MDGPLATGPACIHQFQLPFLKSSLVSTPLHHITYRMCSCFLKLLLLGLIPLPGWLLYHWVFFCPPKQAFHRTLFFFLFPSFQDVFNFSSIILSKWKPPASTFLAQTTSQLPPGHSRFNVSNIWNSTNSKMNSWPVGKTIIFQNLSPGFSVSPYEQAFLRGGEISSSPNQWVITWATEGLSEPERLWGGLACFCQGREESPWTTVYKQ